MFAVIKTGGKQYIVKEGDILDVEKIEGEDGSKLNLDNVLLISDGKDIKIGTPTVEGAKIEAEIVKQFKDKKVVIQKFKRKTGYRRRTGHRQMKTKVKIVSIKS
ncbi:MAG TPA: 50S ribosomal protein L21 [Patescibacteria group bacterium]|nr:50S ribosomal protein L21 [Patescibacteria group bacterium]